MNKIIVIPDVHGRTFWEKVLNNSENPIIFLGDYTDPYDYEGITHEEAIENFKNITKFARANPNVVLLFGNHDLHYLHSGWSCSRYSSKHKYQYKDIFLANRDLFRMACKVDNYLFTHAGISKDWVERNELSFDEDPVVMLDRAYQENPDIFMQYGRARGWGGYETGSPIWCDLEEHNHEEPVYNDLIQVFGHTQLEEEPFITDYLMCLDCRKVFVLENGKLKE